ncbi:MAG: hypothetical protein Q9170_003321 [Blastenia crenularia]
MYFGEQVEYIISHRWGDAPEAQERDWWRDGHTIPYEEKTWKLIHSLLHRSWFEPVWVLQETLSCNRVLLRCGRDSIPWVNLREALLVLRQKTGVPPPDISGRLFGICAGLMGPPLASSEHLLLWTRNQKCTEPQDRIYGILGLLDPRIVDELEVDYSFPVWKTYSRLVLAEKEVYQKSNLLNHCNVMTRCEDSPSWVPNWDQTIEGDNPCPSIRRLSELLSQAIASAELGDEVTREFKDCHFMNERLFTTREGYLGVSAQGLREDVEISVIHRCDLPMILRPRGSNRYEVVGPYFVHGLMLGEALEPPLEPPWKDVVPVVRGWALSYFSNAQTSELLKSDPRLGLLPTHWEEVTALDSFLPPFVFKNRENGHISLNDPRMSAEAIKQRGIMLKPPKLI